MIKVFVSTRRGQNGRPNDFSFTEEGEVVLPPVDECSAGRPDDRCGCKRSLSGIHSGKSTTTFEVALRETSESELTRELFASLSPGGWPLSIDQIGKHIRNALTVASAMEIGAVYERRGRRVVKRA